MTTVSHQSAAQTSVCPFHPEEYLHRKTKWPKLLQLASDIGDTVYYCVGDGGQCSWVASAKLGLIASAGFDRLQPWETIRVYQRLIAKSVQDAATSKNYGPAPWES